MSLLLIIEVHAPFTKHMFPFSIHSLLSLLLLSFNFAQWNRNLDSVKYDKIVLNMMKRRT